MSGFLARCDFLAERGLPRSAVDSLKEGGDMGLLAEFEAMSNEQMATFSKTWTDRDNAARAAGEAASKSAFARCPTCGRSFTLDPLHLDCP